jgi:hypothetical protein
MDQNTLAVGTMADGTVIRLSENQYGFAVEEWVASDSDWYCMADEQSRYDAERRFIALVDSPRAIRWTAAPAPAVRRRDVSDSSFDNGSE